MHKGISAIIVVVVAGLLGITGCGGSSSLSKAEYQQKLELVCNKGLREREEFISKVSQEYQKRQSKPSAEEQTENLRNLMAVYQGTTEEIADLGAPEQGKKQAEELVKAREDATAKVEADPRGALAKFAEIFANANQIAEGLEADSCAK